MRAAHPNPLCAAWLAGQAMRWSAAPWLLESGYTAAVEDPTQERLVGTRVPEISLASTCGGEESLATLAQEPLIINLFPGTDTLPPNPRDPDGLLRSGCTVQNLAFRELSFDFAAIGVGIVGISGATSDDQISLAVREGLPFSLLSDRHLEVAEALELPTLSTPTGAVYERIAIVASQGVIRRVFHPIQIPRRTAVDVLHWLEHGL
jgi:peroxiredoxin